MALSQHLRAWSCSTRHTALAVTWVRARASTATPRLSPSNPLASVRSSHGMCLSSLPLRSSRPASSLLSANSGLTLASLRISFSRSFSTSAPRLSTTSPPLPLPSSDDEKQQRPSTISLREHVWEIASHARSERGLLLAALALTATTSATMLVFPMAMGAVLDSALIANVSPDMLPQAAADTSQSSSSWLPQTPTSSSAVSSSQPPPAWATPTTLMGIFALQSTLMAARLSLTTLAGERLSARLRRRTFGALLQQETAFFDRHPASALVARLTSDCTALQKTLTTQLPLAVRYSLTVTGALGMMAYTSPPLLAVALAALPPAVGAGIFLGRRMRRQQAQVQAAGARAAAAAGDALGNVRLVRDYGAEGREVRRYGGEVRRAYDTGVRVGLTSAVLEAGVMLAGNASMVAVLGYGCTLVADGRLSVGALTSFLLYSVYLGFNTAGLSSVYAEGMRSLGASERVFAILRAPRAAAAGSLAGEDKLPASPTDWLDVNGMAAGATRSALAPSRATQREDAAVALTPKPPLEVVLEYVSFSYPATLAAGSKAKSSADEGNADAATWDDRAAGEEGDSAKSITTTRPEVLSGLNLHIKPGTVAALCGHSGCGKSTVARLLTRLYDVEAGRVLVDGVDIRDVGVDALRSRVAVVQQDAPMMDLSIADNIRYGRPDASMPEVVEAARMAQAHDFISALSQGYDTRVGERGVALSGGQRQRVAIARALLRQPGLLVLDEATSALDAASEAAVQRALEGAVQNRTALIIAHRLSTLRMADVIFVMDAGRIVESGTYESLMAQPGGAFRALATLQLGGASESEPGIAEST